MSGLSDGKSRSSQSTETERATDDRRTICLAPVFPDLPFFMSLRLFCIAVRASSSECIFSPSAS